MKASLSALVAVLLAPLVVWGETYEAPLATRGPADAKLTAGPTVEKAAGGVKIAFAVSAATDVEAAIVDEDGKVVRHLAAGLLGEHAPAPLAAGSLKQELLWDGKDDLGKAVAAPDCSVRVRVGATPRLDSVLGFNGNTLGPIQSLVVGDKSELFVLVRSWVSRGRTEMRVFDRRGRYLRTIMPYASETPADRTKSVGQITVEGKSIPVVFTGHAAGLYPLTVGMPRQTMAWNPKGHIVAVSTLATAFEHGLPRHLLAFDPHGGAPAGVNFVGPEIRPPTGIQWGHGEGDDPCFDHVAVSPDGRWVYFTHSTYENPHAVYRMQWGEDNGAGMEAAFLGEDMRPGSDAGHLNDPQGLAVDASGRIYVCDRGNNRVMVYSPEGKPVGQWAVADPEQIAVHPTTGTAYVLTRQRPWGGAPKDIGPLSMAEYKRWKARQAERQERMPKRTPPALIKFSAFSPDAAPRELARLEQDIELIALDGSADPPGLWAVARKMGLLPLIDRGDRFEVGESVGNAEGLTYPGYVQADPAHNRALIYGLDTQYKVRAIDLTTGVRSNFLSDVSEIALAPDGTIVGSGQYGADVLLRFDSEGKPLNWPGSNSNRASTAPFMSRGLGLGQRGLCVAPSGDIYFIRNGEEQAVQSRLDVYGPDGKPKRSALIDGMGLGDCGVGVDPAGNIYIGANVKPADHPMPPGLEGVVPPIDWLCWANGKWHYRRPPWYYSMRNEYLYHVGAVFKFGPGGGAFYGRCTMVHDQRKNGVSKLDDPASAPAGSPEYRSGYLMQQVRVAGALWRCGGMSLVPTSERLWGDPACVCMTSRLDVDRFGRVAVPDCFRFSVQLLDAAGNRLLRIGQYGNADDIGKVGGRDIYFAWPAFVDLGPDGRLYVSDSLNRRLVVIGFDYADAGQCRLPASE
ncbi:MAG: hypothetical protein BIFFINMI_04405 [Phycisphaerae bacterium]|nr:hypothetical protein [Phycisphaerae bacterium]